MLGRLAPLLGHVEPSPAREAIVAALNGEMRHFFTHVCGNEMTTPLGKLVGMPPFGAGKVTNTHAWLASLGKTLDSFARSTFYSDSQNDIPLLSIVTHPVATNPNEALARHAQAKGWPILKLFAE